MSACRYDIWYSAWYVDGRGGMQQNCAVSIHLWSETLLFREASLPQGTRSKREKFVARGTFLCVVEWALFDGPVETFENTFVDFHGSICESNKMPVTEQDSMWSSKVKAVFCWMPCAGKCFAVWRSSSGQRERRIRRSDSDPTKSWDLKVKAQPKLQRKILQMWITLEFSLFAQI